MTDQDASREADIRAFAERERRVMPGISSDWIFLLRRLDEARAEIERLNEEIRSWEFEYRDSRLRAAPDAREAEIVAMQAGCRAATDALEMGLSDEPGNECRYPGCECSFAAGALKFVSGLRAAPDASDLERATAAWYSRIVPQPTVHGKIAELEALIAEVRRETVQPVKQILAKIGVPTIGVIYVGRDYPLNQLINDLRALAPTAKEPDHA